MTSRISDFRNLSLGRGQVQRILSIPQPLVNATEALCYRPEKFFSGDGPDLSFRHRLMQGFHQILSKLLFRCLDQIL